MTVQPDGLRPGGKIAAHDPSDFPASVILPPEQFMAMDSAGNARIALAQRIWRVRLGGSTWNTVAARLGMSMAQARNTAIYPFGTSRPPVHDASHYVARKAA